MPPIISQEPGNPSLSPDDDPRSSRDDGSFWTFEAVEDRLVAAIGVLQRSGDRERSWLRVESMSLWRQVRPEAADADADDAAIVTCALTRAEVMAADEAMGWVTSAVASGDTRKVLGLGLTQLARGDRSRIEWPVVWRRMGGQASGFTTDGLRMRYGRAITDVCRMLNARKSGG
jgi:hypothetical protein